LFTSFANSKQTTDNKHLPPPLNNLESRRIHASSVDLAKATPAFK
jgi:hypothetical protein